MNCSSSSSSSSACARSRSVRLVSAHARRTLLALSVLATWAVACLLMPIVVSAQDDVVTCGGFVEASSKLSKMAGQQKIDYSAVQMHLYTDEGLLRYSVECAPNGYYFIPVYDRGSYYLSIEGPDGWAFEPKTVPFVVSDQENGCSEDIHFEFTGFSLSGKVQADGGESCPSSGGGQSNEGVAGVTLSIVNTEYKDAQPSTTTSGEDGMFTFNNIFPGSYAVTASHDSWKMVHSEQAVSVDFSHAVLSEPFRVVGFDLTGAVVTASGPEKSVAGVDVFLYATSSDQTGLHCAPVPEGHPVPPQQDGEAAPLCMARSNKDGKYVFADIPCGKYRLVPFHKSDDTEFVVEPTHVIAEVGQGPADMSASNPFQVVGFSVKGRVVDRSAQGVAGAVVLVNSFEKTTTGDDGSFVLSDIRTGTYAIKASKQHVQFHELKNVPLSPHAHTLPDITVTGYSLCGRVDSGEAVPKRLVKLSGKQTELKTTADASGNYCFDVVPGSYVVRPSITSVEEAKGILLSPPERTITVSDGPVLNADFVQARVSISGSVKCLQTPCDSVVQVSIVSPSSGITEPSRVALGEDDSFVFRDMFPGDYKISVTQDAWCWTKKTIDLTVGYEDEEGVLFEQSGFVLRSHLSHDLSLTVRPEESRAGGEEKRFDLTKGSNTFCVHSAGKYVLKPEACLQFEKDEYVYDTTRPHVVELTAIKYLVTGTIEVQKGTTAEDGAPESFQVDVSSKTDGQWTVVAEKKAQAATSGSAAVFEYSFWARPNEDFVVTPRKSASLLFYPRQIVQQVVGHGCQAPLAPFEARPGLFFTGLVNPAVAGVEIHVVAESGDDAELVTLTDADGKYSAGPLYDTFEYSVSAVSEGYHFVEDEKHTGVFRALKLGQVHVEVVDEDGEPIADVMLSLSGKGYANNKVTDASGKFWFADMFPGAYFVRPLLKEYDFAPKHHSLDLDEATEETIRFTGKRVAFSLFGTVASLSGEPEARVVVEAVAAADSDSDSDSDSGPSSNSVVEEAMSDIDGRFRLRGLVPGLTYNVQVKASQAQSSVERATPAVLPVTMEGEDVHGVGFIAFRKSGHFDLTGIVLADTQEHLDSLRVDLYQAQQADVKESVTLSAAMPFFEFSQLPQGDYMVRVHSSLSRMMYSFDSPRVDVRLDSSRHKKIRFSASLKALDDDEHAGSMASLVIVMCIILAVAFRDNVMTFVNKIRGIQSNDGLGDDSDDDDALSVGSSHSRSRSKSRKAKRKKN